MSSPYHPPAPLRNYFFRGCQVYISEAVWREVSEYIERFDIPQIYAFSGRVRPLSGRNRFSDIMDSGEAESAALYQELDADYLVIDDQKARIIAEAHDIECVGTLGVLIKAKDIGIVDALRPLLATFVRHKRQFKRQLLNTLLVGCDEAPLD
ncbi:MAG: DUF3368 domain-containing protein [Acidobacteriota bacterium]|nr:DUF3368 domain-containing protein [Acidobacteriota bacterium]